MNFGYITTRKNDAWLQRKNGVLTKGRTNDFVIHDFVQIGSEGCIAISGWTSSDMKYCLEKDNHSAGLGKDVRNRGTHLKISIQKIQRISPSRTYRSLVITWSECLSE